MTDIQILLAKAQEQGATFIPGEGDELKVRAPAPLPQDLVEELKEHKPEILAWLRERDPLSTSGSIEQDVVTLFFAEEERQGWLVLEVKLPERYPVAPVSLRPELTVADVQRFVDSTIRDLLVYVTAKNRGSGHWVERVLDEKLEQLECCGVKVEIRTIQ